MADNVARAMASLPADGVQTLDFDAIGALVGRSNGTAGG